MKKLEKLLMGSFLLFAVGCDQSVELESMPEKEITNPVVQQEDDDNDVEEEIVSKEVYRLTTASEILKHSPTIDGKEELVENEISHLFYYDNDKLAIYEYSHTYLYPTIYDTLVSKKIFHINRNSNGLVQSVDLYGGQNESYIRTTYYEWEENSVTETTDYDAYIIQNVMEFEDNHLKKVTNKHIEDNSELIGTATYSWMNDNIVAIEYVGYSVNKLEFEYGSSNYVPNPAGPAGIKKDDLYKDLMFDNTDYKTRSTNNILEMNITIEKNGTTQKIPHVDFSYSYDNEQVLTRKLTFPNVPNSDYLLSSSYVFSSVN